MRLAERYEIQEKLGQGGMGTVFKGLDTQTNQPVAIKQFNPEKAYPELIERFKREGVALRELNHPNIVKMLDAVEEGGNHYLIMEYIGGGDLKGLLERNNKLDHQQCVNIAIDIADALTRAHRLDIIHRDLKPANILIAEDGTVRLTDFGIAHIVNKESLTETDAVIGTVPYLSPESLHGEEVDPRADIWAFGVMLFEMLTGRRPFAGNGPANLMMNIITQPTPDLEQLCPDAPISLIDLVYRMLEKDRNVRVHSIRQIGLELEDILHRRANTPPPTRFEMLRPDTVILEQTKHNLPIPTTVFVGRETELAKLAQLLEDDHIRLVTIVAAGGMGKTRLALEAARQHVDRFSDGVCLIELAPVSDPTKIIFAIAEAINFQFQSDGREQKQQILEYLADKEMLLVIDNFEHLLEGASIVTGILTVSPAIQIVATSRQRLNQSGETVLNLSGMDFDEWETPKDALEYAAVKLFIQGANRVQPQFVLTTKNMDHVAHICTLVQGMPLGILLAASWLGMLSVEEIAEEILRGIDFLASDISDFPERHRSIRAVFDYSWELLSHAERDVFMKLSVFKGGFTREAAQKIVGTTLRTLMSLMNKSLIHRDVETGRYTIHELLRQYGEEHLLDSGQAENAYASHAVFFADFMDISWENMKGHRQNNALRAIEIDIENVRLAWHYWTKEAHVQRIKQFLHSMWTVYDIHGWYQAGIDLFAEGCNAIQDNTTDESQSVLGWMLVAQGLCQAGALDFPGIEGTGLSTDIWVHTAKDTFPTTHAFDFLGDSGFHLVQQGIQILQQLNAHQDMMIVPLISTFIVASWVKEADFAVESAQACLDIATTINDDWGVARAKQLLSVHAIHEREYDKAEKLALDALEIFERRGDNWSKSVLCIEVLGNLALILRQFEMADDWIRQGLAAARKAGFKYSIQAAYWQLGYAAALQEKYLDAGKFWQTALKFGDVPLAGSSVFGSGSRSSGGDSLDHYHPEH